MNKLLLLLAQLAPFGLSPKAPGTVASLFSVMIAPFCFLPFSMFWRIIILIGLFTIGICASQVGADLLGKSDPGSIVIDELVGQWVTLLPLGMITMSTVFEGKNTLFLVLGFALFRFFDIIKPGPVGYIDRNLHGGLGIMMDDVMAGILAAIILSILIHFIK